MKPKAEFGQNQENREFKERQPIIRLEFFRHDKKAASKTESGEVIPDEQIKLSVAGRQHAQELGKTKNPNPNVALAYGSPRDRTIETAYRQMLANEPGVAAESSFEDIKELINNELPANSSKEIRTETLNFHAGVSKEFQQAADDRYEKTSDYLKFLWKDSDQLAKKVGDEKADTFSRFAAGIAEIIAKYVKAYATWKRINQKSGDKYKQSNFEMQRFVGTHEAIGESFLMKAIEKIEGERGVNEFLDMLPSKNSFGTGDGFTAEITEQQGKEIIILKYKDKVWEVAPEIVNQIVGERI